MAGPFLEMEVALHDSQHLAVCAGPSGFYVPGKPDDCHHALVDLLKVSGGGGGGGLPLTARLCSRTAATDTGPQFPVNPDFPIFSKKTSADHETKPTTTMHWHNAVPNTFHRECQTTFPRGGTS